MTTIEITSATKVAMLKYLTAGKDLDFVATVTRVPRDIVLDIVSKHGYPDVKRMQWAIDTLIGVSDKIRERSAANSHHPGVPLDEPTKPYQSAPSGAVNIPPAGVSILVQASESTQTRTRNLDSKISALLTDLAARLADEQAQVEAKAAAAHEDALVASRIATLQAEIDKLKGKRRKPAKPAATKGVPRSERLTKGVHPCTVVGCDRTFDTPQGASTHRRRAHEGFNPVKAAS